MEDCIFCKIINGTAPASVVYSDDKVIAFMDISQINPGHVLVIPKTHATGLADLDEETGEYLFKIAVRIATAVKGSGVRCEGVNLLACDGKAAWQSVFHFHLHVIPRFEKDGFGLVFGPNNRLYPAREELDRVAADIARAFQSNLDQATL